MSSSLVAATSDPDFGGSVKDFLDISSMKRRQYFPPLGLDERTHDICGGVSLEVLERTKSFYELLVMGFP